MSDKEKLEGREEDSLRMLLTLNWDQVKHLRSMVMWFTELYVGVIVGAVALLGSADFENQSFLLAFFFIVAVLGLLITMRMDSRIKERVGVGKKVMLKLDLGEYILNLKGTFTWRRYLILFYLVMGLFWLLLLLIKMWKRNIL